MAVDQPDQAEPLGKSRSRWPATSPGSIDADKRFMEMRRAGIDVDHRLEGQSEASFLSAATISLDNAAFARRCASRVADCV